jgi:allophanate hydrolase
MMRGSFSIAGLLEIYASGNLTPVEIVSETLDRIAECDDPAIWIWRVSEGELMTRARALASSKEAAHLPLYGVPFAVKDNIDCAGLPTTAGCPDYSYMPQRDATVVARLSAAGAILIGKTNLDQFATGLVGTRSPYGAPFCVFDRDYISGGSSSGSAKAVAAGLVPFALGTDTAGSGRVPAAFNGIVGLKPTRGLLSTSGVVPACRSLDCVSIFSTTVGDARRVLSVVQGFDSSDPYSRDTIIRAIPLSRIRFGVLAQRDREFFGNSDYAALYQSAIERLIALGGEPTEIDFTPFRQAGGLLYEGPWVAERFAAIREFIAVHEDSIDPTVHKIIMSASRLSAVDAFEGQYRLATLKKKSDSEWGRMDVLLLPTAPTHYKLAEIEREPVELNKHLGLYTSFVNLLDCCAVAVPAGFTDAGLPFGVSLIAPGFSEDSVCELADHMLRNAKLDEGSVDGERVPVAARSPGNGTGQRVNLFVVGAHLSDMPLNHELELLGARFVRAVRTAPDYRLYALPNTTPAKPGLIRAPGFTGPGIEGEVWSLTAEAFGTFVAKIPAPLGIGKTTLEDGSSESSFLCEAYAVEGAQDVTALGGWRAYTRSLSPRE